MKELKFRAWDKEQKVMFEIDNEQFLAGHDFFSNDRFIPMQYIGIKDRTGKEIYEGDIVKHETNYSEESGLVNSRWTFKVVWHFGAFGSEPIKGGYVGNFHTMSGVNHGKENQEFLEIIGNVHENPELT